MYSTGYLVELQNLIEYLKFINKIINQNIYLYILKINLNYMKKLSH